MDYSEYELRFKSALEDFSSRRRIKDEMAAQVAVAVAGFPVDGSK